MEKGRVDRMGDEEEGIFQDERSRSKGDGESRGGGRGAVGGDKKEGKGSAGYGEMGEDKGIKIQCVIWKSERRGRARIFEEKLGREQMEESGEIQAGK